MAVSSSCEITNYIIANYDVIMGGKKVENTRLTYTNNGLHFLSFLISQGGFHANTLPEFVQHVESNSKSQATQAARCTAAKFILERVNILNENVLPDFIYAKLMKFKDWAKSPTESTKTGQSEGELEHIKDQLELIDDGAERTLRKAQFALMAMQGLRATETVNVKCEDFDFTSRPKTVTVMRKGGKKQKVKLFDASIRLIKSYLKFNGIEKGYLFTDQKTGEVLKRQQLNYQWKRFFKQIGIGKYTIHDFRHSLGTKLAAQTGNAFLVKEVLGHSSLRTSQRYVDEAAYRKMHNELDKTIEY